MRERPETRATPLSHHSCLTHAMRAVGNRVRTTRSAHRLRHRSGSPIVKGAMTCRASRAFQPRNPPERTCHVESSRRRLLPAPSPGPPAVGTWNRLARARSGDGGGGGAAIAPTSRSLTWRASGASTSWMTSSVGRVLARSATSCSKRKNAVDDPNVRAVMQPFLAEVAKIDGVQSLESPYTPGNERQIASKGFQRGPDRVRRVRGAVGRVVRRDGAHR